MQRRFGDFVEADAPCAYWRAWTAVASPVATLRTVRRWWKAGLLDDLPTELAIASYYFADRILHVASLVDGLAQVWSLQAVWLATSGAARAASARETAWSPEARANRENTQQAKRTAAQFTVNMPIDSPPASEATTAPTAWTDVSCPTPMPPRP